MNKSKFLSKKLGGKWKYSHPCYWECDDGKRMVVRTSSGVDEFDNPVGPPTYNLYENNKFIKYIYFYENLFEKFFDSRKHDCAK